MLENNNDDQEEVDDVDDAGERLCVLLPILVGDSAHDWVGNKLCSLNNHQHHQL